ncbi:HNH endonuclease [Streptomyces phage Ibantik]|uniref:HNH endonuclease n=1 Tax=Streptomyces phage Ibantik TaxID=2182397 RepID=A0A2U8UP27_9CAUD|nr:HNH endonuclease [Streptomyces phage Ibantik]AWN05330.1 HNH endonuclease [Streptomyces phage Ibantik]
MTEARDIPGYPGYKATSDGRIIGKKGKEMSPHTAKGTGYMGVTVHVGGKQGLLTVHKGVCLAFHGLPDPGQEVAHKNGIRTDNRAENVRWKTRPENAQERVEHGTQVSGEQHPLSKLDEKAVKQIRELYNTGDYKMRELATKFNVSKTKIFQVIHKQSWAHV